MSTQPIPVRTGLPGTVILWFHTAYFAILGLICWFSGNLLFGTVTAQHGASVAVVWLGSALILLAAYMFMAVRSGSPAQARTALLVAFLFDVQAPIAMMRFPGMIHHFEVDLAIQPRLIPIAMLILVGITAFELSRVWREAGKI